MKREPLWSLCRLIAAGDVAAVARLLGASPELARAAITVGATRAAAREYFVDAIAHYVYAGDTALHVAAAAYNLATVRRLLARGADVNARNRRGATALHYATDGGPASDTWNPRAQAATVARLLAAGADVNATDDGGTMPLHRAVRNRCATAVRTLLAHGADPRRTNGRGSTALDLARVTTGRSGSGSPAAKAQQRAIQELLSKK